MDEENTGTGLAQHDPYRSLHEGAMRSIRPTLPSDERSEKAAVNLRSMEDSTTESAGRKSSIGGQKTAKEAEEGSSFQNNVSGILPGKKKGKTKGKLSLKKMAPLFVIIGVLGGGIGMISLLAPVLLPKFIDTQIISKVYSVIPDITDWVIYTFGEQLSGGKIPKSLLENLQKSGVSVGKLLSTGEFSALMEEDKDVLLATTQLVAANDTDDDGDMSFALSIEYKGTVYSAKEVVQALHTNPELYTAFKQALGGNEAILNSRIAKDTYETLGIDNSLYENFTLSGDGEADQAAFEELFAKALLTTGTAIGGVEDIPDPDDPSRYHQASTGTATSTISTEDAMEAARRYITDVANNTTGKSTNEATLAAAAKLNAAISASESYQSAKMYHSLVYPIRLSLDDKGGAINQVMNMLTESKTSYYVDATTGQKVEQTGPAIQAKALLSTISDNPFSANDAVGYSRDRGITMEQIQNMADANSSVYGAINKTVISIGSILQNILNFISSLITGTWRADVGILVAAFNPSISQALFENAYETMAGLAMGTRMVEGAAFTNTKFSQDIGGAMAADSAAIARYNQRNQEIVAWDQEADRVTRSPFDITSPNTFLGSIVSRLAVSAASSSGILGNVLSTASTIINSASSLIPGVHAAADNSYHLTLGNCSTENSIGGQGDMFCNQNPAFDYSTIELTVDDYKTILGSALNADGSINQNSVFQEYVIYHADRESTPGVKDANICKALSGSGDIISQILDALSLNNSCSGRNEKIATGSEYLYSASNPYWDCGYKYFQGYMMKTYALELMGYYEDQGTKNPVVALRDEYYKKHPKDNSYTGILARRSGLLREDVIAGIRAVNYLAYLANYDPSERYSFAEPEVETGITFTEEKGIDAAVIAIKPKYIVYSDIRNRTKIA